jgi:hypothetical protein
VSLITWKAYEKECIHFIYLVCPYDSLLVYTTQNKNKSVPLHRLPRNNHGWRFRPINLTLKAALCLALPLVRLSSIKLIPVLHSLTSRIACSPRLRAPDEAQQVVFVSLQLECFTYWFALDINTAEFLGIGSSHAELCAVSEPHARVRVDVDVPNFLTMVAGVYMVVFVDVDAAFVGWWSGRRRRGGRYDGARSCL